MPRGEMEERGKDNHHTCYLGKLRKSDGGIIRQLISHTKFINN